MLDSKDLVAWEPNITSDSEPKTKAASEKTLKNLARSSQPQKAQWRLVPCCSWLPFFARCPGVTAILQSTKLLVAT